MRKLDKVINILIIALQAQQEINQINAEKIARLEAELEATRPTQGTSN